MVTLTKPMCGALKQPYQKRDIRSRLVTSTKPMCEALKQFLVVHFLSKRSHINKAHVRGIETSPILAAWTGIPILSHQQSPCARH